MDSHQASLLQDPVLKPKTDIDKSINWPIKDNSFDSLEQLNQIAKQCQNCELCETRTNVVVSDGNPNAKLMLIGEGPGEQEDLRGLPFVGRAGQLLDKILEAAGIDRQKDTYICNIVKCRPPGNRVPTPLESEQCTKYLRAQIDFIKPKIVLLLGSTALIGLLQMKNPRITKLHGKWIDGQGDLLSGASVMPFYHPSYLLRNPSKNVGSPKWQAWQAIKEVKAKLDELV